MPHVLGLAFGSGTEQVYVISTWTQLAEGRAKKHLNPLGASQLVETKVDGFWALPMYDSRLQSQSQCILHIFITS